MSSELAPVPPKDKYHAVYFLFLGFGLFSMLPINFFNTATDVSTKQITAIFVFYVYV